MFDSSGRLLIAYDIIEDADSLLEDTTLIFNQHLLDYKTESEDHIYYIPNEGLPKESFDIKFGYTLKQDSIHECYRMKYQRVRINLPRSPR